MTIAESHIRDLVNAVEPTATQKAGAVRSHNFLREILATGQFASRIRDSYLSGSYARDTAIYPLDDVDIVFTIDPTRWSANFLFSDPPPDAILESFANAIRYRYRETSVRTQRRSVCLQLNHVDIDVVPAILLREGGEFIKIPDRSNGSWIRSAPLYHTRYATWLNERLKGRFKPLVKLLKYWNSKLPSTARLKSFAIETIAARLFTVASATSLHEGLTSYFDFLTSFRGESKYRWSDACGISLSIWSREVPDIAKSGSNVIAGVDSDRCDKLIAYAAQSRDLLIEASSATSNQTAVRRIGDALRI